MTQNSPPTDQAERVAFPLPGNLPLAGLVTTTASDTETSTVLMSLEWSANPALRRFGMSPSPSWRSHAGRFNPEEFWPDAMAGRLALPTDNRPAEVFERIDFRNATIDLMKAAGAMPDGSRGLIVFGDARTVTTCRMLPAPLLKVLVEDQTMSMVRPHFDEKCLVSSTLGIRDKIYLSLMEDGTLTVAASLRKSTDGIHPANRQVRDSGHLYLEAMLEFQGPTNWRLEDFAGMSPEEAAEKLEERFWLNFARKLKNPFVSRYGHGLPAFQNLSANDIKFARGNLALAEEALARIVSIGITEGSVTRQKSGKQGVLGFFSATPVAKMQVWNSQQLPDRMSDAVQKIVRRMKPKGAGVDLFQQIGEHGNRAKDLRWEALSVEVDVATILNESGHYHIESEERLKAILSEIGFTPEETEEIFTYVRS
jgi:hypothetical protein